MAKLSSDKTRNDHYNATCCWTLAGNRKEALAPLEQALREGFRDHNHMLKHEDLATLHGSGEWSELVARMRASYESHLRSINSNLLRLFNEDQAGRLKNPPVIDPAADEKRRQEVNMILAKGGAKVADDYYHAAMVFQHGSTGADYRRAHHLARRAVELDPKLALG
jgi:hypothetical protein